MGSFNEIMSSIGAAFSKGYQGVVQWCKRVSRNTKYRRMISQERNKLKETYAKIGKQYMEEFGDEPAESMKDSINYVNYLNNNINQYQEWIDGPEKDRAIDKNEVIKWAGVALAAIIIIAFIGHAFGSRNDYDNTVRRYYAAIQADDEHQLAELTSRVAVDLMKEGKISTYDDLEIFYDDFTDQKLDQYEDKVGELRSIRCKIIDESDLTDRRISKIKENLENRYGLDVSQITEVKSVDVEVTIKGTGRKTRNLDESLVLVKEDNAWKIIPNGLSELFVD